MPASDELAAELRSVIQRHRPDWTNSGDGDPGVTLVELFAFLGDEGREIVVGLNWRFPASEGRAFSRSSIARARERERERERRTLCLPETRCRPRESRKATSCSSRPRRSRTPYQSRSLFAGRVAGVSTSDFACDE